MLKFLFVCARQLRISVETTFIIPSVVIVRAFFELQLFLRTNSPCNSCNTAGKKACSDAQRGIVLLMNCYSCHAVESGYLTLVATFCAMQELQDIDKKGGDEKAWQKSFVRACNHAAMRRVQKSKRAANSDEEADNDCAQSIGTRSAGEGGGLMPAVCHAIRAAALQTCSPEICHRNLACMHEFAVRGPLGRGGFPSQLAQ